MRRLVVAVDCDDVLVQTTLLLVNAYNQKYGTSVLLEEAYSQSFEKWGAQEDEVSERFASLMETEGYRLLGIDLSDIETLRRLAKFHELHLVTARREHEKELTYAMIERDIPGVFTSMEFVGWTGSKGEVCRSIGADVIIDDNINHLKDAQRCGVPNLVWFGDYPWQSELNDLAVVRCTGWREVEDFIGRVA